jgi:hypothetical protein
MTGARTKISRLELTLVVAVALSLPGCVPGPKAVVSVSAIQRAFPVLTRLGLRLYQFSTYNPGEPVCEAFRYGRGAFSSVPGDRLCGAAGDEPIASFAPFDSAARTDVSALRTALGNGMGASILFVHIRPNEDGSVGPGSLFEADRCVTYVYAPGRSALPEQIPGVSVSHWIDASWYQTDDCP